MGTADKNVIKNTGLRNKKYNFDLRHLRLSLKYRPEILRLILKMRQCIRGKNIIVKRLKQQLKSMEQANDGVIQNDDNGKGEDDIRNTAILEHNEGNTQIENQRNTATQTNTSPVQENIDSDLRNKEIISIDKSTSCEYEVKDSFSQTKTQHNDSDADYSLNHNNKLSISDEKQDSSDLKNKENIGIDKSTSCEYEVKDNFSQIKTQHEDSVAEHSLDIDNKLSISDDKQNIISEELNSQESIAINESGLKSCEEPTGIDKLVDTLDEITLKNTDTGKLRNKEVFTQTELALNEDKETRTEDLTNSEKDQLSIKDSSTQTETNEEKSPPKVTEAKSTENPLGWTKTENGEQEKSIAEQVKEVAQSAMQQSGMVYVESAGMYYDYKTGYYYNSELGLYYHTDTGCYYYYSEDQKTFVFHSYPDRSAEAQKVPEKQIRKAKKHKKDEDNAEASKPKRKRMTKHKKIKKDKKKDSSEKDKTEKIDTNKKDKDEQSKERSGKANEENKGSKEKKTELEDGECSESDDEKSESSVAESDVSTATASDDESVAKHHPPCMRVIVRETTLPKLKVGSLFLVTKDGGTIGREGEHHSILLNDCNVSRNHLNIEFNSDKRIYTAVDLGSKNGTILNGVRMSVSQKVSKPMEVVHGSTLQLGETKLLCHIHAGNDTCGHCEPGLIMEAEDKEKKTAYTRTCSVQQQHQLELARLKNKYAPKQLAIEETAYNDRAQARRETVGSSHHSEKTQTADLDTCIAPDNKGFKLLEKMGWSKGEGLGKDSQGDTEPVPLISNEGKSGLGAAPVPLPHTTTIGTATLRLAARTKMLQPPAKAFQPDDDDSE
ncbi:uncharacterized protein [Epargyreus clarus]|uniref:uncharacterized protein isoform X2 n=1 Tax=Epargyreus clarus TaxID=520877 RepID=UPI003C2D7F5F